MHSEAFAMADVIRTSIYCIVSAFHDDMVTSDKAGLLEKDWLISGKPLFGTRELLVQKLKSRLRTPGADRYATAGFVAFVAGALEARVPVERGAWAVAVRFVRWDTGQETAVVPLGVVDVGA